MQRTFTNSGIGLESTVTPLAADGYSVSLHDTDADQVLPTRMIFPVESDAIAYALTLLADPESDLTF